MKLETLSSLMNVADRIRDALPAAASESVREECAFHLAEILGDFPILFAIAEKANAGEPLTKEDIVHIDATCVVHWPYHQRGLKAAVRRIQAGLDNEPHEASGKGRRKLARSSKAGVRRVAKQRSS